MTQTVGIMLSFY